MTAAGDVRADSIEPSQPLRIDVQQLSGLIAFVPDRRSLQLKTLQPAQACAAQVRATLEGPIFATAAICCIVRRSWRNRITSSRGRKQRKERLR